MLKVIVCGSRFWHAYRPILDRLDKLPKDALIITGGAPGADTLAASAAKELGLDLRIVPAGWDTFGRGAGPRRNRKMLSMQPDLVIAFHAEYENSLGTRDCVTEARRRGIEVEMNY